MPVLIYIRVCVKLLGPSCPFTMPYPLLLFCPHPRHTYVTSSSPQSVLHLQFDSFVIAMTNCQHEFALIFSQFNTNFIIGREKKRKADFAVIHNTAWHLPHKDKLQQQSFVIFNVKISYFEHQHCSWEATLSAADRRSCFMLPNNDMSFQISYAIKLGERLCSRNVQLSSHILT